MTKTGIMSKMQIADYQQVKKSTSILSSKDTENSGLFS
jgi:hypothetical protein